MSAEVFSILICKDAGTAGRTLLSRHDLRVRWALTAREAAAVIKLTKCAVIVTREQLAKPVLAAAQAADRKIHTIVMLDPQNWTSWRQYFEAGATSVIQAGATDQLLDAMSDATGLSFRSSPRIPFRTDVSFALGGEGGAWRSLNLSATGICLMEFPPYALGSEVDLAMEIGGKKFEFNAVVVQMLRAGTKRAVGLSFRDLSPELRVSIEEQLHTASPMRPESVEEFHPIDESTFVALRSSKANSDALALMRALTMDGKVARSETTARWLAAACESLSMIEVRAIRNEPDVPPWAHDAVFARLRVYQARWKAGMSAPPDEDVREIFGLCKRLAESSAGADEHSLVQVANIRAEILRALYDPDLVDSMM